MEYTVEGKGKKLVVFICGLASKNYIWDSMKSLMPMDSYRICSIELSEEFNTEKISKRVFYILKNVLKWVDGKRINGKRINGKRINGKQINGKQINIVGWSLGGMVAQKLAAKMMKKRIKISLTLIATTHSFSICGFLRNVSLYKSFNIFASFYSKHALANALVNLNYPKSRPEDAVECFERMMQPDACYYFLFQIFAIITHYLTQDEIHLLTKLQPLIIAGELDEILPYTLSLETAKLLDVPLIIIPNAGHALMNQKPREVFTAFQAYLDKH